jgi:D-alanine-D-alanine ligase
MLKIGFSYNLKDDATLHEEHIQDSTAEYESAGTIEAIHSALSSVSKDIVHLPCNRDFIYNVQKNRPAAVFNIAEGYGGRNREGYAPTVYDMLGIPYTGSDALSLSLTLDKAHTKRILMAENMPTPKFNLIKEMNDLDNLDFDFPMIVKPAGEGTSKGIRNHSRVDDFDKLKKQAAWVIEHYRQPALVEKFITGREFASAVLHNEKVNILPIVEVMFDEGKSPFYSYECKLNVEESLECPARISDELKENIDMLTLKAFKLFDLKNMARLDIRVDDNGAPHILEINALPGLSPEYSLYPIQAEKAGFSYNDMVCEIMMAVIRENGL